MDDENHSHEDDIDDLTETSPGAVDASPGRAKGKSKRRDTLRKAPQAPKRFKSSYICFFMAKQPEIKDTLGDKATVSEISKRSAEMWKTLPTDERAYWDDVASKDKERYMHEKASYTGPWQVPWKRQKKDPSAPKRPMSAFLYFSQGKRTLLKKEHPEMKNTEVSRLLGEMWRSSSELEKRPHVEKEKEERGKYKVAIADWRKDAEARQKAQKNKPAPEWPMAAGMEHGGHPPAGHAEPGVPPHAGGHYEHPGYHPPHPPPGQYMYHPPPYPYPYPPGPYNFAPPPHPVPAGGSKPVILGSNGVPHHYHMPTYGVPEAAGYGGDEGAFDYPDSLETSE